MGLVSDLQGTTLLTSAGGGVEVMLLRAHWRLSAALLLLMDTPQTLHARNGDHVHFGKSITVGEDENAGDLVCIGCSIRMEGTCGDVVAIGGSIMVDGTVKEIG